MTEPRHLKEIATDGFTLLPELYSLEECEWIRERLERALDRDEQGESIRTSRGTVFAARNLLELDPELIHWWRRPALLELLQDVLGGEAGLVRCLYFDKPSHRSWSLPFHKDMTIAVKQNRLPGDTFCKPTTKAGVPHVEASTDVLDKMLTLRIHLDPVTEQNGPLQVIAGSHLNGKATSGFSDEPKKILCNAGDVLAMRPLVSHASGHSDPDTDMNRRILHLEFTGQAILPDLFEWHWYDAIHDSVS